ncbi:MAG: hypothetical protein K8F52_01455 [Candidatus Scalindua rubra]|uniref:Uncharacterized protein n=1 Tax=Candidatus Scalindua brodae TaxID=237368 RepID=A0A0B0ENI6_9BACT|nr:MAG: hypothetical protein SCABRO_02090 [Candidatus Scalindua brodae]MBZ0107309.1 hypothetical protein [Candidatus Scalindua rubra]TWU32066.1 hypothetical protein S225a_18300 [Candidatus Brocadiaceae bacterium S225]
MVVKLLEIIVSGVLSYSIPKIIERLQKERGNLESLEQAFPWLHWCLAHAIGGAVGGTISAGLAPAGLQSTGGMGNWAVYGASLGIAQWFVLRKYCQISPLLAVASTFGWSVFAYFEATKAPGYMGWISVGIAIGVLQWFVLRTKLTRAYWWVPANAVTWFLAGTIGIVIGTAILQSGVSPMFSWILGWSVVGLTGSIITGFAMSRMSSK